MGLNRGYAPWRPEVSPFSQDFRDLINQGLESVHRFEQIEESINRVLVERFPQGAGGAAGTFPAIIQITGVPARVDGPTGLDVEWDYFAWVEAVWTDAGWIEKPDGRNSGDLGKARNKAEQDNPLLGRWHGSGHNLDEIPDGFSLNPIRQGTLVDIQVVRLNPFPGNDPVFGAWFNKNNQIQGACAP